MCLWRRQDWHSQSNGEWKEITKNELFQNLGPNFNNIVNKLPKHSQAFSCGNRRFSRGFNHTWLDRNVILTSNCKTIKDPLGTGKNELLVFFCSSVPVVLFDTPGISRYRPQHVPVESSSLLHHSIYLWSICFPWWSIDELENLHADRTTICFEPW